MIGALLFAAAAAVAAPQVDRGISVEMRAPEHLRDNEPAPLTFSISDTHSHAPLIGARPSAWLSPRRSADPLSQKECTRRVAAFLGDSLLYRASVDLNTYYVLTLNDDATISVVDPRFSFGGSQLLSMVFLDARGEDWALAGDTLFVSMPSANRLAAADMTTWRVRKKIDAGPHPRRVVSDGSRLFVTTDDGISIIDTSTLEVTKRIAIASPEDVVLAGRYVVVASRGSLTIIDSRGEASRINVAALPRASTAAPVLAYSTAAQLIYLADPDTGRIAAIDPKSGKSVATVTARPGFTQLRFAPNGRHALLPNAARNVVEVLDAASNRIIQRASIAKAPDRVTFTDRLAFIQRRESETVLVIPLENVGIDGAPLSVADFPGGEHAFGAARTPADSIVEAPDAPAVLVANPKDHTVYYYKEGMAAPMGGFNIDAHEPRAVLVLDRSLREQRGGIYSATTRIPAPGSYDVVFYLDAPRAVACFVVDVAARPETLAKLQQQPPAVEFVDAPQTVRAGEKSRILFRISDIRTHQPREALRDVRVLAMQAPGVWQQRGDAVAHADGTYEFAFTPPSTGFYTLWIASDSAGLPINNRHYLNFEAVR
jgi:DNA-binding beta-propeller fold protein YncE